MFNVEFWYHIPMINLHVCVGVYMYIHTCSILVRFWCYNVLIYYITNLHYYVRLFRLYFLSILILSRFSLYPGILLL